MCVRERYREREGVRVSKCVRERYREREKERKKERERDEDEADDLLIGTDPSNF